MHEAVVQQTHPPAAPTFLLPELLRTEDGSGAHGTTERGGTTGPPDGPHGDGGLSTRRNVDDSATCFMPRVLGVRVATDEESGGGEVTGGVNVLVVTGELKTGAAVL
ncbi:hypothetical protein AGDE_14757 [Angomonas deanei]|nr:hypothetical protein AGDE_14757 [Angomonas deanei]|eukprot:EPY20290.1 hypothetical protein AGDE_14757 [Angomonas deanei]